MPIHRRVYRGYSGRPRQGFHWAIIVKQELKVLIAFRPFQFLMLFALLHCIARMLQIVAFDIIAQDPTNPLTPQLREIDALTISSKTFFDFIRLQSPLVFVICILAGPGMICNDFNNNLMEIYFSRPISWLDYALGKILTLLLVGLAITAVPAVLLVLLHNLLVPSWDTLQDSYWWPLSIGAFSLVVLFPCVLAVLASSALVRTQNSAAIGLVMILGANSVMGALLAGMLRNPGYLVLSFPVALNRTGKALFGMPRSGYETNLGWAVSFVVVVCFCSGWIVFRRVRRAEIAA